MMPLHPTDRAVELRGKVPGRADLVECVPYNRAFEAMVIRMVRLGATEIYADGQLAFVVLGAKPVCVADYVSGKVFQERVRRMYETGLSKNEIARKVKFSFDAVSKALRLAGVE